MLLLLMVLAVALVSFTLGVMVGKSGSARLAKDTAADGSRTVSKHPAPEPATSEGEAARQADADLTFYETLPKGEKSPLGSGINLPPGEEKPPVSAESHGAVAESAEEPGAVEVEAPAVQEVPEAPPEPSPATEEAGATFFLQVASFRDLKGALSLQEKLHRKGYPAEVREVDLGAKGVWSRVVVGPFDSRAEAQATLERLKREERLTPMIRKG
nr:SPOR domain-containing protein [Desulfuromonadales bacterium]